MHTYSDLRCGAVLGMSVCFTGIRNVLVVVVKISVTCIFGMLIALFSA
jgi:hypothetical protein